MQSVAYEFQFTKRLELAEGEQGVVPQYSFSIVTRGKDFEKCLEDAKEIVREELRDVSRYRMTFCRML